MFSNTGFVGNSYRWFVGQVAPKKNQYQGKVKWEDAWGDRVKVRIPGLHPQDASLKDDDLPWAIVAKPTSHGNFNGGSTGIMGGEWVIGFFMDESCQIPVITHVLGINVIGNSIDAQKVESLGTTLFQQIDRWKATGITPGNNAIVGGPPPSKSAGKDISKDEFDAASTKPSSPETSTGIPNEPKIQQRSDGKWTTTTYQYVDGEKQGFSRITDGPPSQSVINAARFEQSQYYQNETNRLSVTQ